MIRRSSWLPALAVLAASLIPLLPTPAAAQSDQPKWPSRTVRLILPFGPGSGADIGARLMADKLQAAWGHPVIVESKPGGDGLLSVGTVANGKDDHVLFFGPSSAYVVHPYVHENLPYDPERDLVPVAGIARVLICVAVTPSLGINTMKDFIAFAKAEPGKRSYGVAPGFSEFVFNGFIKQHGLQMAKVPYRDITTAPTDLGEGRIQLLMQSYAAMRPHAESGRVKVIAINEKQRSEITPAIPSIHEAGFPELEAGPIAGMLGPSNLPAEARRRASADMMVALKDEVVRDRLRISGQPPVALDTEAFTAALKEQHERVAAIARLVGIARKK